MNPIKGVICSVVLLGQLATLSAAYEGAGVSPTQKVNARIDKLTQELDLNADQQQKVRTIITDEANQKEPLYQQMKSISDQTDAKLKDVLTPEQMKEYSDMKSEKLEKMQKKLKR